MPIETRELTIDNCEVKIVQFKAGRGFKIKARLVKLLLPVLSSLVPAVVSFIKTGRADAGIDSVNIDKELPEAIKTLSTTLEPDQFFRLVLDVLSGTFINGQMVDERFFDDFFVGNYSMIYRLMFEVIKVNNFFDLGGFGISLPKLQAAMKTANDKN